MKADRGSSGVALFIVNLGTVWKRVINFTPRRLYPWKRTPVPISLEPWWVPEPFWTLWKNKLLASAGFEPQTVQPIDGSLYRLFYGISCFAIVLFFTFITWFFCPCLLFVCTIQHTMQISIPSAGFKPTISASERRQAYASVPAVTGIGRTTELLRLQMFCNKN
jgi:hypothetical protein